jgi:hypothetical protein
MVPSAIKHSEIQLIQYDLFEHERKDSIYPN